VDPADPAVDAIEGQVVGVALEHPQARRGQAQAGGAADGLGGRLGGQQRRAGADQPGDDPEAEQVGQVGPRLPGADAGVDLTGGGRAVGGGREDAPLGQRQPVAGGGILAAQPVEGLAEEAQLGRCRRGDGAEATGIGARRAAQARPASSTAAGPSRTAAVASRPCSFSGSSSPSPPKWATSGYSPMQTRVIRLGGTPSSPRVARIWASWSWS